MKILITVLALSFFSVQSFSQKLSSTKVPKAVKEGFKKAHPNSTATWEWEDANYEANFKENGKTMSAVIDKHGTILETETVVTLQELPQTAKVYVEKHYKGKKLKEIAKIDKAGGEVNYEVNVNGKDVLFDASGNPMEKPKKKKEKD